MESDILSSVFMRLRLKTTFQKMIDAAGQWAISMPAHRGVKIHAILRGRCWLSMDDHTAPIELNEGDCYLMPRENAFVIASEPTASRRPPRATADVDATQGIVTFNGGGDCLLSGMFFEFESSLADMLFSSLPSIVLVPRTAPWTSGLQSNIQRFAAEYRGSGVGRSLIMYQLAPIILLDIIRTHLEEVPNQASWFGALLDRNLSTVLNLMHTEYSRHWTLEQLALSAGVSRSKLAVRFNHEVGTPPMDYLSRWRVEIARDLLASGEHSIAQVANMVGYRSESAFSAAFKRILGHRPGHYMKIV